MYLHVYIQWKVFLSKPKKLKEQFWPFMWQPWKPLTNPELSKTYNELTWYNLYLLLTEFANHGRHELAAYVTIGLVLGAIGLIGAIKYARGGGVGKHSGRLACSTQVISCKWYFNYTCQSVLLVEETGIPGDNHRPVASHWQSCIEYKLT
jgi:hypothetical protein